MGLTGVRLAAFLCLRKAVKRRVGVRRGVGQLVENEVRGLARDALATCSREEVEALSSGAVPDRVHAALAQLLCPQAPVEPPPAPAPAPAPRAKAVAEASAARVPVAVAVAARAPRAKAARAQAEAEELQPAAPVTPPPPPKLDGVLNLRAKNVWLTSEKPRLMREAVRMHKDPARWRHVGCKEWRGLDVHSESHRAAMAQACLDPRAPAERMPGSGRFVSPHKRCAAGDECPLEAMPKPSKHRRLLQAITDTVKACSEHAAPGQLRLLRGAVASAHFYCAYDFAEVKTLPRGGIECTELWYAQERLAYSNFGCRCWSRDGGVHGI